MPFRWFSSSRGNSSSSSSSSSNGTYHHNTNTGSSALFSSSSSKGRPAQSHRLLTSHHPLSHPHHRSSSQAALFKTGRIACSVMFLFLFLLALTVTLYSQSVHMHHQQQQKQQPHHNLVLPLTMPSSAPLLTHKPISSSSTTNTNALPKQDEATDRTLALSNDFTEPKLLSNERNKLLPEYRYAMNRANRDSVPAANSVPEDRSLDAQADYLRKGQRKNDESAVSIKTTTPPAAATIVEFSNEADFVDHAKSCEAALKKDQTVLLKPIAAFVEPPLRDTVPNTGTRGDPKDDKAWGTPPEFVNPLPRRTHTPADLIKYEYGRVRTCHDMPGKFPIDRGLEIDTKTGEAIVWNVGNKPLPPDFPDQEAPYCPVEKEPFLPWIHDVFPSQDGSRIEFIAQNKRRCRTGSVYTENIHRLVPQSALMQSVSVEILSEDQARELAPDLWHPGDSDPTSNTPRYRLASYEEASPEGMFTRFICRFHITKVVGGAAVSISLGETLSEFPFNYELVSYRKGQRSLLSPNGKDTRLFWASNLHFSCPLPPSNDALRNAVANGVTVLADGTPSLFVDLIPIQTSVRYAEIYLTEDMIGPKPTWDLPAFDPQTRWGPTNVLPRVEASSRWTNIPICLPPELVDGKTVSEEVEMDTFETTQVTRKLVPDIDTKAEKPHFLSACLWASSEFKTRGKNIGASTDTTNRLQEWIEFHLLVGFDHFYVYDNSGAHTNETSLAPVLDLFPGKVTRIDWPSIVCNNNIPAHDSTGERSSQYAAENSCRSRFGPFSEWMAAFDTDEYFVPMGNYTNLKDVLKDVRKQGTNILTLRSSRGKLRMDKSTTAEKNKNAMEMLPDKTYLEAYNCDSAGSPKPVWADRARKQIYRPDYVLYHYVHYSTVTKGYLQTFKEAEENGKHWNRQFGEDKPSERVADELTEVVMVHTKTLGPDMTTGFNETCRYDYPKKWQGCWVAYPWPAGSDTSSKENHDADGMEYNCHINTKVDNFWVPKLLEAIGKRRKK